MDSVVIQQASFDVGLELQGLHGIDPATGALATFVGFCRDSNEGDHVAEMYLEHYPGMTERSIGAIVEEARGRWDLLDTRVVHRVGHIAPTEPIVLVAVTSSHRGEAFAACEFIMDFLKTRAPFWKRERTGEGERWVSARGSDEDAASRWDSG